MKDRATPTIDVYGDGTKILDAFADGDPFVTVRNLNGIHGAQGPSNFFQVNSPDYIYLQSDFTTAAAQSTYKTKIYIEFYLQ